MRFERQQFGKRLSQLRADDVTRHDPNLLKDRGNEQRLHAFRRLVVQPLRVIEQRQGIIKALCERRHFDAKLRNDPLGSGNLPPYALLVCLELVQLDRVGVVGILVLLARLFELGDACPLLGNLGLVVDVLGSEVFEQRLAHSLHSLRRNLYTHPVVTHGLLNQANRHIALRARRFVSLTTKAVKVRVTRAEAVLRHDNTEPTAAHRTEQVALQVVRSLVRLVLVLVASVEQCVYSVKGSFVDERFMVALVFDAVVRYYSGVVPIVQHPMHRLDIERPFRQVLIGGHSQPEVIERVGHICQCANARVVQLETLGHERPGELVNNHDADVLTIARVPSVFVSDRGFARRAAELNFFAESLFSFFAQVG